MVYVFLVVFFGCHESILLCCQGSARIRNELYDVAKDIDVSDVVSLRLAHTIKSAHQQPISAFKVRCL